MPQGLLIVGTPAEEPWHMTAHLTEESRLADLPGLMPTLVRWAPPAGARPHLSVGIERLEQVSRSETVLVVSPDAATEPLLERVAGARKAGAAIFALDQGDPELDGLVHESLVVRPDAAPISFDAAQHLVSFAVGDPDLADAAGLERAAGGPETWRVSAGGVAVPGWRTTPAGQPGPAGPQGLRGKLNRLLGVISGPQPD